MSVRFLRDASFGVGCAHQKAIIHRDLKPANIMLDREARIYVLDFGLAKLVSGWPGRGPGITGTHALVGTPAFMAPEQVRGAAKEIGPQTDVYSLGATLWALLGGGRPMRLPMPPNFFEASRKIRPPGFARCGPRFRHPWRRSSRGPCRKIGADDYIVKPYSADEFVARVERYFFKCGEPLLQ
ncbi:MAG: protein kinase [Planctomycetes bacterium]|nr:protein kinase [Planctomycetota bacterium]